VAASSIGARPSKTAMPAYNFNLENMIRPSSAHYTPKGLSKKEENFSIIDMDFEVCQNKEGMAP
jgi:hypothetical protein